MLKKIALLLLLASCGKPGKESPEQTTSPELLAQLTEKYDKILPLSLLKRDSDGFIVTDECDSLLFSSLFGSVSDIGLNITAARDSGGKWHRRPLSYPECYPASSGSTISRDMFWGLFWYIWNNRQLALAEELYAYGSGNDWIMGDGDVSRTYMTPGMQGTLSELIYRMGGKNHQVERNLLHTYSSNVTGFEAHLMVLSALIRAEMLGVIEDKAMPAIEAQFARQPKNALFSYAYHKYTDGNQDDTIALLLDEKIWPRDRLPTSRDRKEQWIFQRDYGADWQPDLSKNPVEYAGADFLFVAHLILKN
jgi:hypothetical protein